MKKIALVTPVKDEIHNLDRFFSSLSSQTYPIDYLVVVENDSIDGTQKYLEKLGKVNNIKNVDIINMTFKDKRYDLGFKLSLIHI